MHEEFSLGQRLLFCLLGDILLMFYVTGTDTLMYLLVGGFSFFIARCIMTVCFVLYPYKNNFYNQKLKIDQSKIIFSSIISLVYTGWMIIYFWHHIKSLKGNMRKVC